MKELEFTEDMIDRNDSMDQAVFKMCLVFLQLEDDPDKDTKFPWDVNIIGDIFDFTVNTLRANNFLVCDPSIVQKDGGNASQFCNTEVCGFKECKLHP